MLKTGHSAYCVIISGETEEEYSQLQVPRSVKHMEGVCFDEGWGIIKKVRLPLHDIDKIEKKLLILLEEYLQTKQPIIWMVDNFKTLRTPEVRFLTIFIKTIISEVLNGTLKLYEYASRTIINKDSDTMTWKRFLTAHYLCEISSLSIINDYKGRKLERLFNSIDWDRDVFIANSAKALITHPDLFRTESGWVHNMQFEFGKIEGMYQYFKARDKRMKRYHVREMSHGKWSACFSIFTWDKTVAILNQKFNTKFKLKDYGS